MKFLITLCIVLASLNLCAQDKMFLQCRGTLRTTIEKSETSKPDISNTSSQDIFTEIAIDLKTNSMKPQLPLMNVCPTSEACDCKFSKDSFSCKNSFEYGKRDSPFHATNYKNIDISRKSGFANFSYLSTS